MNDVTVALSAIQRGDARGTEALFPLVYDELRKMAAQRIAQEKPGHTLQATALVNEAYLRLVGATEERHWEGRGHFFAAAAVAMRRILVENARRKGREKHGGGHQRVHADLEDLGTSESPEEILSLHDALEQFALQEPLKAKLVEMRFFGGLTLEEAAACLGISLSTADRAWRYARAWLYTAMAGTDCDE